MDNGIIGQRINEALAFRNVKQKELAKELGVKDNVVSYWCSGSRVPNVQQIMQISNILNVSADYLTGISEAKTNDIEVKAICDYTGLTEDVIENLHAMLVEEDEENENIIDSKFVNNLLSSRRFDEMVLLNRKLDTLEKSLIYYLAVFFEDKKIAEEIKSRIKHIFPIFKIFDDRELLLYKFQKDFNLYFEQLTKLLNEISNCNLESWCYTADIYMTEKYTYSDILNNNVKIKNKDFQDFVDIQLKNDLSDFSKLKEIYERYKDE